MESTPRPRPARRTGDATSTSRKGFASMDAERQRELASKGGKASHVSGKGHQWTSEQAREAGRKGGQTSRRGKAKKA